MTTGGAVLFGCLGLVIGYLARILDVKAAEERRMERLRPFGPARSHCRLRPAPYDQERDHGLG